VSFKKICCKLFRRRFLYKINNRITSALYASISIRINWMGLAWNVIRCFRRAFLYMEKKDINKRPWLGTFFEIFWIGFIADRLNTSCAIRLNGIKRVGLYFNFFFFIWIRQSIQFCTISSSDVSMLGLSLGERLEAVWREKSLTKILKHTELIIYYIIRPRFLPEVAFPGCVIFWKIDIRACLFYYSVL